MNILLAFAPFIVFALVDQWLGTLVGLVAAALTSVALLIRDRMRGGGELKVLEVGTTLLFGGLAAWGALRGVEGWSVVDVRLKVDLGLLAIVVISIVIRKPFTLQYARERVSDEIARSPRFLRINDVITSVWALAFVFVVAADLMLLYWPQLPIRFAVIVTLVALAAAFKFTTWYPQRAARQAA